MSIADEWTEKLAVRDKTLIDQALEAKVSGILDEELAGQVSAAKYKLEVMFFESRSTQKAYAGVVVAWRSGGALHGGGDAAVYFCPKCNDPIDLQFVSTHVSVCPSCKQACKPADLTGQYFAKLETPQWAALLERMFRRLESHADIRIGLLKGNLHQAMSLEQNKECRGDQLEQVREARTWVCYPLETLVQDLAAGSSLEARLRAFLNA